MPNYRDLGAFGRNIASDSDEEVRTLAEEFRAELAHEIGERAVELTPIASPPDPRRAPGLMRRQWKVAVGARKPGPIRSTRSVVSSTKLGRPVSIVNNAPHAIVIDGGLGRAESGPAVGRKLGSDRAPRGVAQPALEAATSNTAGIRNRAHRRTAGKVGK